MIDRTEYEQDPKGVVSRRGVSRRGVSRRVVAGAIVATGVAGAAALTPAAAQASWLSPTVRTAIGVPMAASSGEPTAGDFEVGLELVGSQTVVNGSGTSITLPQRYRLTNISATLALPAATRIIVRFDGSKVVAFDVTAMTAAGTVDGRALSSLEIESLTDTSVEFVLGTPLAPRAVFELPLVIVPFSRIYAPVETDVKAEVSITNVVGVDGLYRSTESAIAFDALLAPEAGPSLELRGEQLVVQLDGVNVSYPRYVAVRLGAGQPAGTTPPLESPLTLRFRSGQPGDDPTFNLGFPIVNGVVETRVHPTPTTLPENRTLAVDRAVLQSDEVLVPIDVIADLGLDPTVLPWTGVIELINAVGPTTSAQRVSFDPRVLTTTVPRNPPRATAAWEGSVSVGSVGDLPTHLLLTAATDAGPIPRGSEILLPREFVVTIGTPERDGAPAPASALLYALPGGDDDWFEPISQWMLVLTEDVPTGSRLRIPMSWTPNRISADRVFADLRCGDSDEGSFAIRTITR